MQASAFGRTAGAASGGSLKRGANFGGGRSFGSNAGYDSTPMMNFRGQDKRQQNPGQLGMNPNEDAKDDYIVNLQQQIHFMELELKILKEKVLEDEQKSGIGNLYDDDKTSHQHITLLKTKYAQMKKDFDHQMKVLQKQSLKVKGQEFVLDAQVGKIKEQTNNMKDTEANYNDDMRDKRQTLTINNKDGAKQQSANESELRAKNDELSQAERTHYDHTITQDKAKKFEAEALHRHDLEVTLYTALKVAKEKELAQLEADLAKIKADFLSKADYQNALKETAELKEKIENAKVQVQFLEIQVTMLSEQTEWLTQKRDDLTEEKKLAESKNEELKTQAKAQEEIANKRLQNQLNRNKSAEIKELLANEEMVKATNDDLKNKFRNEKENYDNLLSDKMMLEEQLLRLREELKIDTAVVSEQDLLLAELKKQIEAEQTDVDALQEDVDAATIVNKKEDERNRRVHVDHTSHTAKITFIENNYEGTMGSVEQIDTRIFENIMESNKECNQTIEDFKSKTTTVQQEFKTLSDIRERERRAF